MGTQVSRKQTKQEVIKLITKIMTKSTNLQQISSLLYFSPLFSLSWTHYCRLHPDASTCCEEQTRPLLATNLHPPQQDVL